MEITEAIDKEVNLLQDKLRETLKKEEERGANIRSLDSRVGMLGERAQEFHRDAAEAKRKLWWRNFWWLFCFLAIIFIPVVIAIKVLLR